MGFWYASLAALILLHTLSLPNTRIYSLLSVYTRVIVVLRIQGHRETSLSFCQWLLRVQCEWELPIRSVTRLFMGFLLYSDT